MNELATISEVVSNPIIVLLVGGLPATIGLIWTLRKAEKKDRDAAAAAVATASGTAVQQVIDALNHLADNLQEDNKALRKNVDSLSKRLGDVVQENHDLKVRVAELTLP